MLKVRVIACLLLDDGQLCRTKKFAPDYRYTQEFVATEAVDEVFIVDVTKAGPSGKFHAAAKAYADKCFVPITMGGWVATDQQIKNLMFDTGADKIVLGRAAAKLGFIEGLAEKHGSQLIVAGVDRMIYPDGDLVGIAADLGKRGAGEIFLQSVERDGSLQGYDIQLLKAVNAAVDCPVVIGGGVGNWGHMAEAFEAGASGCATSNIFHMTEGWMTAGKKSLQANGVPVRP